MQVATYRQIQNRAAAITALIVIHYSRRRHSGQHCKCHCRGLQNRDSRVPEARPAYLAATHPNRGAAPGLAASVPARHCGRLWLSWDSSIGGHILIPCMHSPLLHIAIYSQHLLIEQQAAPARTCNRCQQSCPACRALPEGACAACRGQEKRGSHVGQVAFRRSQSVTQALWKIWPQGRDTTLQATTVVVSRALS